ncbi:hypothetical protein VXE32_006992 [Burkholderia cepacia]|nr:hypothetical protein [Burkholderia cepacia]
MDSGGTVEERDPCAFARTIQHIEGGDQLEEAGRRPLDSSIHIFCRIAKNTRFIVVSTD